MGVFSWTCSKTNLPIMNNMVAPPEQSEIVLLREDGSVIRGSYDGYGRITTPTGGALAFSEEVDGGTARLVLAAFFDPEVDTFDSLPANHWEPGQGHFHDDAFLRKIFAAGGFRSFEEYQKAYQDWGSDE